MLNRANLASKFTALLLMIFLVGSAIAGLALGKVLHYRAEKQVTAEGIMLLESMQAVRSYTDQQVRPALEQQATADAFWPESIPAYSSRRVFELLKKSADYRYKEAVINPTNPKDLADDFESSLVSLFAADETLTERSGYRTFPDKGKSFYSALPIVIREASCLECHSTPEAAPPAMLAQYGRENGFGWELNKVLGTQVVYVPAEEVFRTSRRAFASVMGLFFLMFAIALLSLNHVLKNLVIQPVQNLAKLSEKLAADDIQTSEEWQDWESKKLGQVVTRRDELGQLGKIFERMGQEVIARQQRLRQQIRELKIEIDETRKAKEVKEIVESDYFQSLQEKAKKLRDRD